MIKDLFKMISGIVYYLLNSDSNGKKYMNKNCWKSNFTTEKAIHNHFNVYVDRKSS